MTFYSSTLPAAHLSYLKLNDEVVPVELKASTKLFYVQLGLPIAIGLGTLTIVHIGIKSAPKPSIIGILR